MIVEITNSNNEKEIKNIPIPDLPEETSTSGYIASVETSNMGEITTNAKSLIEVDGADKDNYFTPDAREQIEKAMAARQHKPRNRAERRALMKKMGKQKYNEFMAISETAAKLDYVDLIQKFRELNERKANEKENEDNENIEENN